MLYSSQDSKGSFILILASSSPHPLLGNLLFWRFQNAPATPISSQPTQREPEADKLNEQRFRRNMESRMLKFKKFMSSEESKEPALLIKALIGGGSE